MNDDRLAELEKKLYNSGAGIWVIEEITDLIQALRDERNKVNDLQETIKEYRKITEMLREDIRKIRLCGSEF